MVFEILCFELKILVRIVILKIKQDHELQTILIVVILLKQTNKGIKLNDILEQTRVKLYQQSILQRNSS